MTGFQTITACPSGKALMRNSDPQVVLLFFQKIRGIV